MSSLARLSFLKSPALLKISATTWDAELKLLLKDATARACSPDLCNRALVRATYTDELYSGDGSRELWLREYPVTAVSAMKVFDGTDYSEIDSQHYGLVDQRVVIYPLRGISDARGWPEDCAGDNIQVTYTAGYDTTNWDSAALNVNFGVPADLERAVATLAALSWLEGRGDQGRLGMASMARQAETLTVEKFERGIPPEIERVFKGYRRVTI